MLSSSYSFPHLKQSYIEINKSFSPSINRMITYAAKQKHSQILKQIIISQIQKKQNTIKYKQYNKKLQEKSFQSNRKYKDLMGQFGRMFDKYQTQNNKSRNQNQNKKINKQKLIYKNKQINLKNVINSFNLVKKSKFNFIKSQRANKKIQIKLVKSKLSQGNTIDHHFNLLKKDIGIIEYAKKTSQFQFFFQCLQRNPARINQQENRFYHNNNKLNRLNKEKQLVNQQNTSIPHQLLKRLRTQQNIQYKDQKANYKCKSINKAQKK